jgi:transposase
MDKKTINPTTCVGIDVSKSFLDVYISQTGEHLQVKNENSGYLTIVRKLKNFSEPAIVMEATGGYEKKAALYFYNKAFLVAVVNPKRVRDYARGIGQLAKTDKIDAKLIASYGEKVEIRFLENRDEIREHIRELMNRRRQLVDLKKTENNHLEHAECKETVLSIKRMVTTIENQIKKIEQQVDEYLKKSSELINDVKLLTTVPGVGKTTAILLLVELPELGTCNRKTIAMLAGLAPINRDSGNKKGKRSITEGREKIRTALYMPTISALSCNPAIRDFSLVLKSKGKPGKVVNTACMRKLLTILNAVMRDKKAWGTEKQNNESLSGFEHYNTSENESMEKLEEKTVDFHTNISNYEYYIAENLEGRVVDISL